jgi:flagellar assembly protein FliH
LDLKLATEHTDDFVKAVENVTGVKVVEDSTVGQGGCIVETDFGAIDARISSQLMELEQKIRELSPVRARRK